MSDLERATRARMERLVAGLQAFSTELAAIRSSLPPSEREDVMYAGEEDWDFPTEARSVIECVLADWLGPAIRDLQDAAVYGLTEEGHAPD
jgi:hypothetical protein